MTGRVRGILVQDAHHAAVLRINVTRESMSHTDPDVIIASARAVVLEWVAERRPGKYVTNSELAKAFCDLLPDDVDLELGIVRNPSALVYEARWSHGGRDVSEFPKPFCAEEESDARILACAALVALQD
jgi:hypothetical protein